jgi:hypothetical protein
MKGFIEKVATSHPYREQHYNFVHNHLQIISFTRPEMLRAKLASWGARRYLIRLWNKCGSLETEEPIPAGSLSCCIKKDGRAGVLAIITLPEPVAITEAYFAGIYFYPARRSFFHWVDQKTRYFTLEKSYTPEGAPSAFLCEWEITGHLNHGILKELSMEAFVEQVKILAKTGWRDSRIQAGD